VWVKYLSCNIYCLVFIVNVLAVLALSLGFKVKGELKVRVRLRFRVLGLVFFFRF